MERPRVTVIAAAMALLVGAAVVVAMWGSGSQSTAGAPERHDVVVRTKLVGPRVYYMEGAVTQVTLHGDEDPDGPAVRRTPQAPVGDTVTWAGVPTGGYDVTGAVFPCNGNCGETGPKVDACALPLEVAGDVEVVVTFRWGKPCEVRVLSS